MLQKSSLSLIRSCISGSAQLESGLNMALGASTQLFSTCSSGSVAVSQQQQQQPASALALRQPSALSTMLRQKAGGLHVPSNVRFAHGFKPEVPGNSVDNWTEMRATYNVQKPSSLGANYYLNVLVFGFAYWLNDAYYFPSRTLWIGALVFFALYVRKGNFSTPLSKAKDY